MLSANLKLEEFPKEEEPFGLGCALELFSEVEDVLLMIDNLVLTALNSNQSVAERTYDKFFFILSHYQEQPHLLDSHIDIILEKLINIVRNKENDIQAKHFAFKFMFVLIKVRGYKVVVRHLPHEVSDFEPVLQLLEAQDSSDADTWMTRYVLLLWLSIIVLIPFHMSRLDGFDANDSNCTKKTVMCRVLDICKIYMVVSDKCRDGASYLAAKFLTRYDVKQEYLAEFFDWACNISVNPDSNVFVKYGCLASVAMILKHGKREDLVAHAPKLLQWIVNAEFKDNPGTNIQKLVYKNVQRIGLTFLPARIAKWRYQRGNRSLAANLSGGDTTGKKVEINKNKVEEVDNSDNIEVPDEIEEVIDQLIQGLRSIDGVVRWSAAKGVGRITSRLPKELADEVVGSVLELFNPREGDGAWHGGCLALAELGRRGLLLPQRLPEVVPVILRALVYDEPRGYSSVGSHIRDAACYVTWSFARAYETNILKPFVKDIASNLLIVTCFDREINCRRAASAAFQENVGRQGTFPHGIDILTTADFFSVSVRNNAYQHISVYIAEFEEYTVPLIKHLLDRKVDHWDVVIRELTAKALHNLTEKNYVYVINTVLPTLFEKTSSIDLNCRHGSVLSIGEILFAISKVVKEQDTKIETSIGDNLLEQTKNLISKFNERLYYRGLGGELMRQSSCAFIEKCCLSHMPFHDSNVIDVWLKLLNDCLIYDVTNVRMAAIEAMPAFFNEYYNNSSEAYLLKRINLVNNYVSELSSSNQISRMGHSLALGTLPSFMLCCNLNNVLEALILATRISPNTLKWAESRRDAIKALTSICATLENVVGEDLTDSQINAIYKAFLNGLVEYTQDNRGDIGAWVRESSMVGLQTLTLILAKKKPALLTKELVMKIVTGVAQQAVEKIDRTRAVAGKIFYSFIHNEPQVPQIPNRDKLIELFPKAECELLNWNSAAITFPKFVELIRLHDYTYNVLLGFVCSVGGLTETLVKYSSSSFFSYLNTIGAQQEEIVRLCDMIYKIFCDYQKNDRITISMFKFLRQLMSSSYIVTYMLDSSNDYAKKILKLVQLEIADCKDIYKLIDGVTLLCEFVQIKTEVCSTALIHLSILLCHRRSYIRRSTANALYESLLVYGYNSIIPESNLDEIMVLLSETNWDDPVDVVKPTRNNICKLMNIRVPVPKKKS